MRQITGGLEMKEFYKEKFVLTNQGARDLVKATYSSFFVYCINMHSHIYTDAFNR